MQILPKLEIRPRKLDKNIYQQAINEGVHPLLARVFASRLQKAPASIGALIQPGLQQLAPPQTLADIQPAVARLVTALKEGQNIGLVTDYDVDGLTSHVVLYRSLTEIFQHPASKIHSFIGHRIHDGYGLSQSLVERILQQPQPPQVIITADCGSSDAARIEQLKAAGIDVIVTDHHAIPKSGLPASAHAVINPSRLDCNYPDKTLAGCGVSWLLMAALRNALIQENYLPANTPKLSFLLAFVALGTVADCVSLGGSAINRAFVNAGLQIMNGSQEACWQAFRNLIGARFKHFDAGSLGFQLGPRINASSRMDDPYQALHFLLAPDLPTAESFLAKLDSDNLERRAQEAQMLKEALLAAQEQVQAQMQSLVAFLPEGHPGVQGIVASRLSEKYGLPSVVLTPSQEARQLTASARSVDGINIHAALQRIDQLNPGIFVKFGGHPAAAGLTIWQERLADFQLALNKAVLFQLAEKRLHPVILTDGILEPQLLSLETLALLNKLEPYGREFEAPLFEGRFQVQNLRPVGADGTHLQLELTPLDAQEFKLCKAIWFRALKPQQPAPFNLGASIHAVYRLSENHFRGETSLQLLLSHAQEI